MKKSAKWWFVFTMTLLTVLAIFLVADAILMGLIALMESLFDKALAFNVYKWGVIILFGIETLVTIPATFQSTNKGDK